MAGDQNDSTYKWKERQLLFRYYRDVWIKRALGWVPFTLLIIASLLLLVAMSKTMREGLRTYLFHAAGFKHITVHGVIEASHTDTKGQVTTTPVGAVLVECGGSNTISSVTGEYSLVLYSPTHNRIPLVVTHNGKEQVFRFDATPEVNEVREDITLK